MSVLLALTLPFVAASGPIDTAVRATEVPNALRAAFTVELKSSAAQHVYAYDPRLSPERRWQQVSAAGTDAALDAIAAQWAAEASPDSRLFAEDMRANLSHTLKVDDFGSAWRVRFDHRPRAGSPLAAISETENLLAEAWIEPVEGRMMRLDYRLQQPVSQADGSELSVYSQSYQLAREPAWGLSYIAAYDLAVAVTEHDVTKTHAYQATIQNASFFFATPASEDAYRTKVQAELVAY